MIQRSEDIIWTFKLHTENPGFKSSLHSQFQLPTEESFISSTCNRHLLRYLLTWQKFNNLLQFLFKSNIQDAISLINHQTLQVLIHKPWGVLTKQKPLVSCHIPVPAKAVSPSHAHSHTCMWSRSRPGVATMMLIPLASFCASADLLLPPIIRPYVCTWWVISSFRTPNVCMASSLVGDRIRTPVPKVQTATQGRSQN